MEGLAAADGGRSLKSGLIAFGALIWAAPVFGQSSPDPLAPLPVSPPAPRGAPAPIPPLTAPAADQAAPTATQQPSPVVQPTPPVRTVAVPKDWRGVFDAIDSGNWASAQAGLAALPRSILAPLARAELYTARGSPVVDLASLQALIAEAPELPQAEQLATMAYKRGATDPILV